ncbi:elongation factor 2-like [Prunus yedoensis var. nudiflora]|uniref:Elongation factor 2-like n=1 Tax=Prunus yedoensis var. nudiflora TaxID=2094558 RepID=A0A314Z114_PRUYE|nr:elongation factor 2-like [Prunus yedoensis var. nudiflora]
MKFSVSPVVHVAVQWKVTSEFPNLLKDLQDDFMGEADIIKSDPVVFFRENVLEKSSRTVMSKSPNKHNRLYMEARPLEEGLPEAIDDGRIGPRVLKIKRLKENNQNVEKTIGEG